MSKTIKWFLSVFGILIFLVIASAIILPFIYKDKIIEYGKTEANKHLNAHLDFNNDISIGIIRSFPDFTLEVNNVKIINKVPFEGDTLVVIPKFRTTLDILSVIRGEKIKVKSVTLDKPYLNFKVLENGTANWDIAFPDNDSLAKQGKDTTSNFRMALKHYELNDATVIYDDKSTFFNLRLDGMNHSGSGDFTSEVFDLVTHTSADRMTMGYSGINYLQDVNTDLDAKLNIDNAKSKYTFKENDLRLNDLHLNLDGFVSMPGDDIDMDINFKSKQTDFKSILSLIPSIYKKDFKNVKAAGSLALNGTVKGRYNDKTYPGFNTVLKIDNGSFRYPDLPTDVRDIFIDMTINNPQGSSLDNMVVNIKKAHLAMAGEPFDAHMTVNRITTDPYIDGAIKGKIILERLKDIVKLDPGTSMSGRLDADVMMKGAMSAVENGHYDNFYAAGYIIGDNIGYSSKDLAQPVMISTVRLDFNPRDIKMNNLNMTLGKSDLHGQGAINNILGYIFKHQLLRGDMTVKSNLFDLNPWMATTSSDEPTSTIDLPGDIDFTLNATVGKVIYQNLNLTNLHGIVNLADKKATFTDIGMDFLNGKLAMNGSYDSKNPKQPSTDLTLGLRQVSIPEIFRNFNTVKLFAPIANYMTGNMDADVSFKSLLSDDMKPILNTITSKGRLIIERATLSNYLPLTEVGDKLNFAKFNNIVLTGIRPSYEITNGRFTLKDPIRFVVEKIKAEVTGSNGFDKSLDYAMALDIPATMLQNKANSAINDLLKQNNLNVLPDMVKANVLIKGTIDHPVINISLRDFAVNTVDALKNNAKDIINQEINKKTEEVKTKAKDEANRILRQAQDQADRIRAEARNTADVIRKEADQQGQNLVNQANNPIAKLAAQKAADKLKSEADKKANDVINEADRKADEIMKQAQDQVNKL